jgi:hypothetical protein
LGTTTRENKKIPLLNHPMLILLVFDKLRVWNVIIPNLENRKKGKITKLDYPNKI